MPAGTNSSSPIDESIIQNTGKRHSGQFLGRNSAEIVRE